MTCIKMGSDERHFNVSVGSDGQSHRTGPQTTIFLKRKESRSGIEPRSFRLPALPVIRFSKWEEEYSIEDVDRLAFLRIMTSSRSLGCCRSKTWRITSRIGACQVCLHLMFTFTDVCACEIRRREVNEACRCARPDGIAPSKVSTSDDACDDHFLISAKSETLLSRPLSASMYTNFA